MFASYLSSIRGHAGRWALGAALAASAACVCGPAWAQLPPVQHYGSVQYVTGGFGADESAALKAAMPNYPLALTFAASDGQRAAFVSQVRVVVRNQYDVTVLNVESQGPFLLARLEPGTYQVFATYRNQTQSRPVTLADGKSARVVFEWQRSEPIRPASPTTSENETHAADATGTSGTAGTPDNADTPEASNSRMPDSRFQFTPGSIPGLD